MLILPSTTVNCDTAVIAPSIDVVNANTICMEFESLRYGEGVGDLYRTSLQHQLALTKVLAGLEHSRASDEKSSISVELVEEDESVALAVLIGGELDTALAMLDTFLDGPWQAITPELRALVGVSVDITN